MAAERLATRCCELLAERDEARLARCLTVLQMLPSKSDAPDADQAEGWLFLLSDMPIWAVEAASAAYAKANKWRPAPFEIIDIAERIARPVKMLAKR